MTKEKGQEISFQIIGYAGDAFSCFSMAMEKAKLSRFEEAAQLVEQGEAQLVKAHNVQTGLLVEEANNNSVEVSLLLVHAQDHLMMTTMYEKVTNEMIALYRTIMQPGGTDE